MEFLRANMPWARNLRLRPARAWPLIRPSICITRGVHTPRWLTELQRKSTSLPRENRGLKGGYDNLPLPLKIVYRAFVGENFCARPRNWSDLGVLSRKGARAGGSKLAPLLI